MSDVSFADPAELLPPPLSEEWIAIIRAFADTPDDEEAQALLANHPEIRAPEHVAALVGEAGSDEVSDEEAERLTDRAAQLCGPDWPDGPELVSELVSGMATLVTSVPDRAARDRLVDVARRVSDPDVAEVVPAGMISGLLTIAAWVLVRVRRYSGDDELLDEALTVQRRAVEAGPGEGLLAALRSHCLAATYVEKFDLTGDRTLLEEAIAIYRRAAELVPSDAFQLFSLLCGLAAALDRLCTATGRGDLLREAITIERRAISQMESIVQADDDLAVELRPVHLELLQHLASFLTSWSHWHTGEALLGEAVTLCRRVVDGTPDDSPMLPARLAGLAATLRRMYQRRSDREVLAEAVAVQRRAVETTVAGETSRDSRISYLADLLAALAAASQDAELLEEAGALIEHLEARTLIGRVHLARVKARVVRHDEHRQDRFAVAAREVGAALGVVEQLREAEPNPVRRRDLAQQFDGLLGDLVTNVALSGNVERAVELIEADRVWLSAPTASTTSGTGATHPPVPVAWVASSWWETVVISTTDHRSYRLHTVATDRPKIYRAVTTNFGARPARAAASEEEQQQDLAAQREAVNELCAVATDIAKAFPRADHLLIVPVGACALLPYAAAQRGGRYLVDETALTVAPSLAWARAAHRPRPDGASFGAFHPGNDADRLLPLETDRRLFKKRFSEATILDRPQAEDVLGQLDHNVDVAHFSCHGTYDVLDPFESKLHLETGLTVRSVLDQATSPWLVNLSACWTGLCDLGATEQQIGLPTAFLQAGTAHVLANLWPTRTRISTIVNADFYRHLADGAHPAIALRRAIRYIRDPALWRDETELHPLYWAPFTHFGSATPLLGVDGGQTEA